MLGQLGVESDVAGRLMPCRRGPAATAADQDERPRSVGVHRWRRGLVRLGHHQQEGTTASARRGIARGCRRRRRSARGPPLLAPPPPQCRVGPVGGLAATTYWRPLRSAGPPADRCLQEGVQHEVGVGHPVPVRRRRRYRTAICQPVFVVADDDGPRRQRFTQHRVRDAVPAIWRTAPPASGQARRRRPDGPGGTYVHPGRRLARPVALELPVPGRLRRASGAGAVHQADGAPPHAMARGS